MISIMNYTSLVFQYIYFLPFITLLFLAHEFDEEFLLTLAKTHALHSLLQLLYLLKTEFANENEFMSNLYFKKV